MGDRSAAAYVRFSAFRPPSHRREAALLVGFRCRSTPSVDKGKPGRESQIARIPEMAANRLSPQPAACLTAGNPRCAQPGNAAQQPSSQFMQGLSPVSHEDRVLTTARMLRVEGD